MYNMINFSDLPCFRQMISLATLVIRIERSVVDFVGQDCLVNGSWNLSPDWFSVKQDNEKCINIPYL